MKITESIERECCEPGKDLIEYKGLRADHSLNNPYRVCKHCGQIWEEERYMDAAGSMDTRLVRVVLP